MREIRQHTSTRLGRSLRCFACPQEPFDDALAQVLATAYHAEAWRQLVRRSAAAFAAQSGGLVDTVAAWLAGPATADDLWDRALGLCREALGAPRLDPVAVAAAVGLRAAERAAPGEWWAELPAPAVLRFGPFVLPAAGRLAVRAEGTTVEVRAGGDRFRFARDGAGQWTADAPGLSRLPAVAVGARRVLLHPGDVPALGGAFSGAAARAEVERALDGQLADAVALLAAHSREYLPWIDRVLRGIAPLAGGPTRYSSSSSPGWHGVVALSFPAPPAALAEMLVHECSHQHFQQVEWLGGVDDGSDRRLHYSPVKRTGRPIAKILLAYHAFANVLLMNQRFLAAGVEDGGYCRQNQRVLVPQLRQLEQAILSTTALTPSGIALYEPLAERVREVA
jgi:HEXXH motif-containing protein